MRRSKVNILVCERECVRVRTEVCVCVLSLSANLGQLWGRVQGRFPPEGSAAKAGEPCPRVPRRP